MDVYARMKELNISLPKPPAKAGIYAQAKRFGKGLVYISGCGPVLNEPIEGKLGQEFDVFEGREFARNCMLNVLAVLEASIGDLNKVKNCVKILTLVREPALFTIIRQWQMAAANSWPTFSATKQERPPVPQ